MAEVVAIVGPSGSGKSTSIRTLPSDKTAIINISGKRLPFKGSKAAYKGSIKEGGNYAEVSTGTAAGQIIQYIGDNRKDINYVIIEDAQYIQAFEFMRRAREKGYDKFSDIAHEGFEPVRVSSNVKRDDLTIFFIYHEDNGQIKTSGKMIDNHITMEGMFSIVLFTHTKYNDKEGKTEYFFQTQTDGKTTAKSPMGMFDKFLIPNDLGYVAKKMKEYYE